jgi:hypothetical protein
MKSIKDPVPQLLGCDRVPMENMEDVLNEADYFVRLVRDLRDDMYDLTSGWDVPGGKDLDDWVARQATVLAYGVRHAEQILQQGHRLTFAQRGKCRR